MQHRLNRHKACATLFSLLLFAASSLVHADWEEKYYNPKPLADDVLLPMPCGGQMAFRKISIPLAAPFDDYPLTLGQDGDAFGYLEQSRATHIAGSFTTQGSQPSRYYLLEKYELSELQYQSVMQKDGCPTPSNRLRLPQTEISWFEAIAFADRYNLWLRQNAPDKLPLEDGARGFVRLPTEAEWEFAARGGLAVSEAQFRDVLFPMPDGALNAYAWFAGAQSASGKRQLTGLLKPNPLGLHDMLGNVDEMLFEPFRLTKPGREHGQAGGFIVRGGNYLTPADELRSALRAEQPYYSADGEQRLKTSGVRLALVSPVLTSRERIREVEKQWQALGTGTSGDAPKDSALGDIGKLAEQVEDKALKQQLEKLRSDLRSETLARDEQRDQAIRSELQLGAFLCTKLKDDGLFLDTLQANYARSCQGTGEADTRCSARQKQLQGHQEVLDFILNYYADTVVASVLNYSPAQIKAQLDITRQQMQSRSKNNLQSYLQVHWQNLSGYLQNGRVARTGWLEACKAI